MSGRAVFHPLRVSAVEPLTHDAVEVTFDVPPELVEAYSFVPGQHVTVRTAEAGDDSRRNYSICMPAGVSSTLRIGVKRLAGGGFSSYALDRMSVGDVVDVMTPTGRFCTRPDPSRSRHVVGVAAGSGITPIMSVVASLLADEPKSTISLLYGNRNVSSVMFLDELADLKDRYPERFQVFHVLSGERPDVDLFAGRITAEKLERFLDTVLPPAHEWFLCGPYAMVEDLRAALLRHGVRRECVHSELFHVGPPAAAAHPRPSHSGGECEVTAVLDGRTSSFRLGQWGVPVLEAVLDLRSDAPYACRGGVCGTCRARVLEGAVSMDRCYALEPEEVARGYVLTCQSHPTTERLVVDYDA